MSLARYVSKLAALLGSDGKVPAAGLATGAAVSNIGYTPLNAANNLSDVTAATARTNLGLGTAATQNSTAFDAAGAATAAQNASLQKSSNLSDLSNAGSARGNIGLGTYDSGWYSVAKDTSYVKTHSLGSNNLLIITYFSYDASNAAFVTYTSFHSNSHLYTGGCVIADINGSSFTVRTGWNDCCGPSPYPNTDTMRFGGIDHLTSGGITGYYRNVAIRLG